MVMMMMMMMAATFATSDPAGNQVDELQSSKAETKSMHAVIESLGVGWRVTGGSSEYRHLPRNASRREDLLALARPRNATHSA